MADASIHEEEGSIGDLGLASDPLAELPVKSSKYVKACTELYLGHKDLCRLEGFEPFVHLHTLWLNGNRLERITNLDRNFRIKNLYIQDNLLRSLTGSIQRFTFLQVLHCFNNKLNDLPATLSVLSRLQHLNVLDLFGNPIAEEPAFRAKTIHRLTGSLQVLDRIFITSQERSQARIRCAALANSTVPQDEETRVTLKRSPEELAGRWSSCTQMLFEQVEEAARQRQLQSMTLRNVGVEDEKKELGRGEGRQLPLGKYLDFKAVAVANAAGGQELSVWEKFRLAHMLDELGKKEVAEDELLELLSRFADYAGKEVERGDIERRLARLREGREEPGYDIATVLCELTLPDVPWRPLSKLRIDARSEQLFEQAKTCYKEIQFGGNNSEEASGEYQDERRRLHQQLVCATRLQCIGKQAPLKRDKQERTAHPRKDFYFDRPFRTKAIAEAGETIASMPVEEDGRAERDVEHAVLARKFGLERALKKQGKRAMKSPFSAGPLYV